MTRVSITVCDICGEPGETYYLSNVSQIGNSDLCDAHAQPLWSMVDWSTPTRADWNRRRRKTKVVTMDELEKLKAERASAGK